MVKIQYLAQFLVDHFTQQVMHTSAYYVINVRYFLLTDQVSYVGIKTGYAPVS